MQRPQPLSGITVYELGHSIAAPYAGLVLADLGARVVKVENPSGGDYARGWGPPFWNDAATTFLAMNRGKESVSVDFSDPTQAEGLRRRIVAEADAVIQNLRPGILDRYGLSPHRLSDEAPELVWCDIGAFGSQGPLAGRPGYDPLMQAFSGVMSVTGEGGRPPIRVGVSVMDMAAGMWAVIAILTALIERGKTGRGAQVSTSLYETGLAWMTGHLAGYCASGEVRMPFGSGVAEIVPYQAFSTADGWLMVAAGNDNLFRKLCGAIGREDLAADPTYATNAGRVARREELLSEIEASARAHDTQTLAALLDAAGVPNAPIQTVDQVMDHPQTKALRMVEPVEGDTLPLMGIPISFDGSRPRNMRPAPLLGESDNRRSSHAAG
ncbi:CoA transferase [Aliihoeflea sp. 2WW]|uniref:CaiB/BaiF CoA transferase family protein n=1 Tax=Aliihoeflea sp. 2WW TaxID=1381123 RepID=UPI000467D388|nr:CoA transferase [Aliihoeflea sp. 2WW]